MYHFDKFLNSFRWEGLGLGFYTHCLFHSIPATLVLDIYVVCYTTRLQRSMQVVSYWMESLDIRPTNQWRPLELNNPISKRLSSFPTSQFLPIQTKMQPGVFKLNQGQQCFQTVPGLSGAELMLTSENSASCIVRCWLMQCNLYYSFSLLMLVERGRALCIDLLTQLFLPLRVRARLWS